MPQRIDSAFKNRVHDGAILTSASPAMARQASRSRSDFKGEARS
jgi:hypothetical protein